MNISVSVMKPEDHRTDAVVLPLYAGEKFGIVTSRIDRALGGMISRLLKQGDFSAKPGSIHLLYPEGRIAAARLILAGVGPRHGCSSIRVRQAVGKAASDARAAGATTVAFVTDSLAVEPGELAQAFSEGSMLGLYRYLKYKTGDENGIRKNISKITLLTERKSAVRIMQRGVKIGSVIAESTAMVRDMVSQPPADMTPTVIAAIAKEIGRRFGLTVRVFDRRKIQDLGMGGLLGVAAGSVQQPKFIILEHRKGGKKPFIALVGKTITFDSGGISIKPAENMDRMKDDMSGGAAVLGVLRAAAALRLPLNIVGLLPATENMPSGSAYRPGDVLRTMSGQTIEVLSTDAEGRLILSDALAYACRYKPAAIIDIATLTGSCAIALGNEASGMLGNDDRIKQKLREAGEKTGERVWELPLWDEYFDLIKSDIADMKNTGGRAGGVITAAALLSKFVGKYPWAHLDIAATAWTDKDRPFTPKGATGVGVRLLAQFLLDYERSR